MRPVMILRTLFATKLGACAFCIRLSLLLSVVSWAVFGVLGRLLPYSAFAVLALALAIGFTALFSAHLVAFVVRVTLGYRRRHRDVAAEGPDLPEERRRFLATSLRMLGLALLPSVIASAVQARGAAPAIVRRVAPPIAVAATTATPG